MLLFFYSYYILPLRIFFDRIKPTNGVEEDFKFGHYFAGVALGHFGLLFPCLFDIAAKQYNFQNPKMILWISVFVIFVIITLGGCQIGRYFITRHQLSCEQLNNRKLFLIGGAIFFEWIIFLLISLVWFLWSR